MRKLTRPAKGTAIDFRMPVEVYYEDTDLSGVVYHANYLKYFERARTKWVRHMGLAQGALLQDRQLAFTVADLQIRYLRPVRLDDELEATLTVILRRRAQIHFYQCLRSPAQHDTLFAETEVRVACVDTRDFRPCALPPELISGDPQ